MKLYSSFLLRCWVIRDGAEKIVFDIEHIQKGERRRLDTPQEALQWIITECQNQQPEEITEDADTETDDPEQSAFPTGL